MPLEPGEALHDRYRIVKLLGKGGFGAVYRAWDDTLKRPCAIKENLNASPELQRQFTREASLLANLSHPNLPHVTDHFILPGQGQYLVMDFVEGQDLKSMLDQRRRPLPEAQALAWIGQVCDALTYLHVNNPPVIHRDVKPSNIRITPDGRAMLVDFGIAKLHDPVMEITFGARAITPGYSPQEQYGVGATDARSDVYALGATLYNLLTGQRPPESIRRAMGQKMAPPRSLAPSISPHVEAAILRAMEMWPEQRFQSAAQFKAALAPESAHFQAGQQAESEGETVSSIYSPRLPRRRAPAWVWVGAALIIALLLIGACAVLGGWFRSRAAPARTIPSAIVSLPVLSPVSSSVVPQDGPHRRDDRCLRNADCAYVPRRVPRGFHVGQWQGPEVRRRG